MIDLDPSIIDQDSIRKKRRKKMLLVALAPIIILLVLSVFCLRPGVFDFIFSMSYQGAQDGGGLIPLASMQKFANILEPYIAYYDLGTAYIKDSDFVKAESELRTSLSNNPPEDKVCNVRVNLSYSLERQGDDASSSGQYDKALLLYSQAEGVLYEDSCATKNDSQSGKDDNAERAVDRISQKRGNTVSKMNGGNGNEGNNGNEMPSSAIELSEEMVEQLRNSVQNGNEVRMYIYGKGSMGGSYSISGKHW